MIAVAIACSSVTYFWVTSMVEYQSARSMSEVRIEYVRWIDSKNLVVGVRDLGVSSVTLESVSVSRTRSGTESEITRFSNSISSGGTTELKVTLSKLAVENRVPYYVRITTTTGFYYETTSLANYT